jgi:hypothetical protein
MHTTGPRGPGPFTVKATSMNQSTVLPIALTSVVVQQLSFVLGLSAGPCQELSDKVASLTAVYLAQPITPASTFDFENNLRLLLDECGRLVLQSVFNNIEPQCPDDVPKHTQRDRLDYCRKNTKTPLRGGLATRFGPIDLLRWLNEPLQEARDDSQRSFSPLELSLGIVAGNATPALAERVGRLASQHTQQEMLDLLKQDHHVHWSVAVLRNVTAAVSAGIASYLREAQQRQLLAWLQQANASRGRRRPTLCMGRDGIMMPIRGEKTNKEGAVATLSVYDRRGRRLGTVYLGEMPEAFQLTLSGELTALVQSVLGAWQGPMPRLVYVTDAGYHQTTYFEKVLVKMENPRQAGKRLEWLWIVDYYHAAGYVSDLAKLLFTEEKMQKAWSQRMRHVLLEEENGVYRVLHSAAYYHAKKELAKKEEKEYQKAYDYLSDRKANMDYKKFKDVLLPIGSGVTEAACKIVFTQRFKASGMTWGLQGGKVILRLRLAVLSGVWEHVYNEYLIHRESPFTTTQLHLAPQNDEKAA